MVWCIAGVVARFAGILVAVAGLGACFDPAVAPCSIACSSDGVCPSGLRCEAGLCVGAASSCAVAAEDADLPATADAAPEAGDAAAGPHQLTLQVDSQSGFLVVAPDGEDWWCGGEDTCVYELEVGVTYRIEPTDLGQGQYLVYDGDVPESCLDCGDDPCSVLMDRDRSIRAAVVNSCW